MVPGQAQSGWKAVIGYVCSLDDTSISFLFSAELRVESWAYAQGIHWATSPAHFMVIRSVSSVYAWWCAACIEADTTNPSRLLACGNTCVKESACHAFLWGRLIEMRTMTPSLTHSGILFTGRGLVRGLDQGFLAACRVCCNSWCRSAESSENGTQPSGKKARELSWPLSKLNTFFFYFEGVYALL